MKYEVYKRGIITKLEAGVIYKASKEGKLEVLPETIKYLYDDVGRRFAGTSVWEVYMRNREYFDGIYDAVSAILNENDFEKAQDSISKLESKMIELAGKKSIYFKYRGEERC